MNYGMRLGLGMNLAGRSAGGALPAPLDPLAGIPSLLDLRTHKGDKVPFGIDPVGNEPNPSWMGVTGGAAQSVETKQPLTKFAGDDTPYLSFDGVDDWMALGEMGGEVVICAVVRSRTLLWDSYWSIVDGVGPFLGSTGYRWGMFSAETNEFLNGPFPTSARCNGVDLSSPFPVPTPSDWNVITYRTQPATLNERGLGQLDLTYFGDADYIALRIMSAEVTTPEIQLVENYFQTLKPSL